MSIRCQSEIKGISLVELLVVVAIISILSVSSFVGFGYLSQTLQLRQVNELIQDTIKQEELKILRGDFTKSTIHFLKDYMVIEEIVDGSNLALSFDKTSCNNGVDYKIEFKNKGSLLKKDKDGKNLNITGVVANGDICVDFADSDETEWNYQLVDSGKYSDVIKFIHFNIKRDSKKVPIFINISVAGAKMEIKAPYGKKYIYDNSGKLTDEVKITVKIKDNEDSEESFTLK